MKHPNTSSYCF